MKTDKVGLAAQEARRAARKAMAEYESTRTQAAKEKVLAAVTAWQRTLVALKLKRNRTRMLH